MVKDLDAHLKRYRLSRGEYELICQKLGREPRGVEWALFSALWSEHCSYKSSRVHLKKFFSRSERVVEGFGENAGVIDLGQGERVAFKMESHNHPSYIEPYQGAATGVGGILRDIFTMGARPIALADYLCFGEPAAERMTALVDGVVRGIGGYGNCVGVPTVTGQTEFHESYNGNILVNALALGLFRPGEKVFVSKARGPGNYVVYVGAKTGRDGVHGASMASESFGADSASKRPTVQIGDPFYEKLLIESCIEVMAKGLVVAIQDMGAAGLTSSSFEMASKGGVGLDLHLDRVPLRDSSITPEEILLSESQERMLLICEPQRFAELKAVFDLWDLDAAVIGEVRSERVVRLHWHGEEICAIDPDLLVENAPRYERAYSAWSAKAKADGAVSPAVTDVAAFLESILKDVRGGSRRWIYQQYDQRVGGKTAADCEESVAVLRLPDSGRALGLVLGCRPSMMRMDAQQGGRDAIAYPALELAAKGFEPLAVTDCLNFGNPERPEVMSELVAAIESMSAVCEALKAPVISGNVSLYNETLGRNVTSTPSTGLVGLREEGVKNLPTSYFEEAGGEIFLAVCDQLTTDGLAAELLRKTPRFAGDIDPAVTAEFAAAVRHLALHPGVRSSRLVGKFGLAYALARMTLKGVGADVASGLSAVAPDPGSLFAEVCYRVLFVARPGEGPQLAAAWKGPGRLVSLGRTGGDALVLGPTARWPVGRIRSLYDGSWEATFEELA